MAALYVHCTPELLFPPFFLLVDVPGCLFLDNVVGMETHTVVGRG